MDYTLEPVTQEELEWLSEQDEVNAFIAKAEQERAEGSK